MIKNSYYVYGDSDLTVPAYLNFGEFILNKLWQNKDKNILINGSTNDTLTCGEISQEAMNLAVALTHLGLRKGEVVALCSENRREFWPTVIGIACTGAVLTTFNPGYTKDELKHVMGILKPKYVFCSPQAYSVHETYLKSFVEVKNIILFGERKQNGALLYDDLTTAKRVTFEEFKSVDVKGETDTLFILYSSGTSGLPKGVMQTHLNVLAACNMPSSFDADTSMLIVAPWYHAMGMIGTLRCFSKGITLVYLQKFDMESYLNTIELYKISQLTVVPALLVALCKHQSYHDVSSIKLMYSGGSPLHSDTINAVRKRFPKLKAVLQGYGMTEATLGVTRDTYEMAHLAKPGGVGYVVKNTIIKVVDIKTRKPLGPNQTGEICVKGVLIMKGYIGKENNSGDDFDEEGFFKTGDIGYYDDEKYFFIVDRLKELIKYKAYQVAPMEIEAVLLKHDGVRDVGVVGLPNAAAGEVPLAFVVPQPGATLSETELQQFVAERLSNPKRLRGGVKFVKEIPKNPSGKILRKHLREMAKSVISKL
ncbi:unnamed protein product [Parnassius mnemosyne]|uniref:Luciferin 4-monooxygenase n=1 Tax=Parnassius mnemosyne TaxID=213953 RepID=A0AAV1LE24_9NEOP